MHDGKRSLGSKHGARIKIVSDWLFAGFLEWESYILHDKLGIGNWELGIGNRES